MKLLNFLNKHKNLIKILIRLDKTELKTITDFASFLYLQELFNNSESESESECADDDADENVVDDDNDENVDVDDDDENVVGDGDDDEEEEDEFTRQMVDVLMSVKGINVAQSHEFITVIGENNFSKEELIQKAKEWFEKKQDKKQDEKDEKLEENKPQIVKRMIDLPKISDENDEDDEVDDDENVSKTAECCCKPLPIKLPALNFEKQDSGLDLKEIPTVKELVFQQTRCDIKREEFKKKMLEREIQEAREMQAIIDFAKKGDNAKNNKKEEENVISRSEFSSLLSLSSQKQDKRFDAIQALVDSKYKDMMTKTDLDEIVELAFTFHDKEFFLIIYELVILATDKN